MHIMMLHKNLKLTTQAAAQEESHTLNLGISIL